MIDPGPMPLLRRAGDGDAASVAALVDAAYGHYAPLLGRTPFPMLADYAAVVRDHEVWVLDAGGDGLVGVIELVPHPDHLWIENVAIQPGAQGRGYGRRLLEHAEDRARQMGLNALGLLTNERYLANIAMYERYGYRETHREPYQGTDLVHFRKALPVPWVRFGDLQPGVGEGLRALWRSAGFRLIGDDDAGLARFAARNPGGTIVAVAPDGRIVGSALAAWDGRRGWLYHVAVAADLRRTGLGTELVRRAEARLRAIGCPRVLVIVEGDNDDALVFWERLGYVSRGTHQLGKSLSMPVAQAATEA